MERNEAIALWAEKGVSTWERTLKPKQTIKLKYGYTVTYPEDKIVPSL